MKKPKYQFTWTAGARPYYSVKATDIAMAKTKVSTLMKLSMPQTNRILNGLVLRVEEI